MKKGIVENSQDTQGKLQKVLKPFRKAYDWTKEGAIKIKDATASRYTQFSENIRLRHFNFKDNHPKYAKFLSISGTFLSLNASILRATGIIAAGTACAIAATSQKSMADFLRKTGLKNLPFVERFCNTVKNVLPKHTAVYALITYGTTKALEKDQRINAPEGYYKKVINKISKVDSLIGEIEKIEEIEQIRIMENCINSCLRLLQTAKIYNDSKPYITLVTKMQLVIREILNKEKETNNSKGLKEEALHTEKISKNSKLNKLLELNSKLQQLFTSKEEAKVHKVQEKYEVQKKYEVREKEDK